MKGHVRERGEGNWYAIYDAIDPATGKRKRKWERLEATARRQAQTECNKLVLAAIERNRIEPEKLTVAAFFIVG